MAASSRGSLAGEGPPGIERLRQAVDAGVREPAAAECVPALSWIASMRPNGSGAASSRGAGGRERTGLAMPMRGGGALSARAPKWAGESGRTRKGRRPAPTPLNETHFSPYEPIYPIGPAPRRGRAPRAFFSVPGSKKEGPAVFGGPLGYPWWSLGGSNP